MSSLANVVLLRQPNLGIAAALNRGIAHAQLTRHYDAFLTVDQDSELAEDYVARALATAEPLESEEAPYAVCAQTFNEWRVPVRRERGHFQEAMNVAQSGMLIPLRTWTRIGRFDESLFIDGVDTDYVFRIRRDGGFTAIGEGCAMTHEVGVLRTVSRRGRPVRVGGKILRYSYHSAARRYYITRNRVVLWRRYFSSDPVWQLKDLLAELRTLLLCLLFGPERAPQLRGTVLGLLDGIRGRRGALSAARLVSTSSRDTKDA